MEEETIFAKRCFLKCFNKNRTTEEALDKAVNSSVKRAYVYSEGTTIERTAEIRKFWKEILRELCKKYTIIQTIEVFEHDMIELQQRMNENQM